MKAFSLKPSFIAIALLSTTAYVPFGFAATPINLAHKSVASLQPMEMKETHRLQGKQNILHIRLQQTYAGYPVYGADAILHVPGGNKTAPIATLLQNSNAWMNGVVYQSLQNDLANTKSFIFSKAAAQKALQRGLDLHQQQSEKKANISQQQAQLIIYVDDANKAHYAYKVNFFAEYADIFPEVPTYIMDAATLHVYKTWNDVNQVMDPRLAQVVVRGGGFGGTPKTGKISYDGAPGNAPSFLVTRDAAAGTCTLINPNARLKRNKNNNPDNLFLSYPCAAADADHNNVFWSGELINSNGSYSTANDPMAHEQAVRRLFQDWYGLPVVVRNGHPEQLTMVINYPMSGAILANSVTSVLSMGDGSAGVSYPYTTRDIVSHELGHAFLSQYVTFPFNGEGGAVSESFGDMTAKALEYHITGSSSATFGNDLIKNKNKSLRYLDTPTRDCDGRTPGDWCSIDHISQYNSSIAKHYAAGVYNRALYTLSTKPGWDTHKVYDVLVGATMYYWTSTTGFTDGACGITHAASDYGLNVNDIHDVFNIVGIDTSSC